MVGKDENKLADEKSKGRKDKNKAMKNYVKEDSEV